MTPRRAVVWQDARRWIGRTLLVLAFPWLILTSAAVGQVEKGEAPRWLALLPTAVVLMACAITVPIGIRRGHRMRAASAALGWEFEPQFRWPLPIPTDLFPFDGWGRGLGDGSAGNWRGDTAAVATIGARTTVVAVWASHRLPTIQLVPNGFAGLLDAGHGTTMSAELVSLQRKWRVIAADPSHAHAAFPPTSLAALDAFGSEPIIAFDGNLAWTTDPGVRLKPEQIAERLDLLAELAHRVPAFARPTSTVRSDPTPFFGGTRERNILGRLSVLLPLTLVGAPFGIWAGVRGLRAQREGRADNRRTAKVGVILSSCMTLLVVWWISIVILEEASRQ